MTNATDALRALPDQWDEFAAKCIEPAAAHAIKTCASELRLRLATPAGSAAGETTCERCNGLNSPPWFAPHDLWNRVAAADWQFLCPSCFTQLAEAAGVSEIWSVKPNKHGPADYAALQAEVARACEINRALADDLCAAEAEAARLRENARVLAAFARTAPGRLPVAVQDAVAAMRSANGQADAADTTAGEGNA